MLTCTPGTAPPPFGDLRRAGQVCAQAQVFSALWLSAETQRTQRMGEEASGPTRHSRGSGSLYGGTCCVNGRVVIRMASPTKGIAGLTEYIG